MSAFFFFDGRCFSRQNTLPHCPIEMGFRMYSLYGYLTTLLKLKSISWWKMSLIHIHVRLLNQNLHLFCSKDTYASFLPSLSPLIPPLTVTASYLSSQRLGISDTLCIFFPFFYAWNVLFLFQIWRKLLYLEACQYFSAIITG